MGYRTSLAVALLAGGIFLPMLAGAQAPAPLGPSLPQANHPGLQPDGVVRDQLRILQQELAARGYEVGAIDGVLGERTRAAIRAYQRDKGLPVTGKATRALVAQLQTAPQAERRPPAGALYPQEEQLADLGLLPAYVQGVQEELQRKGYYKGDVDGVLGTGTRSAVKAYQRQAGLPPTGEVSQLLLDHLRFARPQQAANP